MLVDCETLSHAWDWEEKGAGVDSRIWEEAIQEKKNQVNKTVMLHMHEKAEEQRCSWDAGWRCWMKGRQITKI